MNEEKKSKINPVQEKLDIQSSYSEAWMNLTPDYVLELEYFPQNVTRWHKNILSHKRIHFVIADILDKFTW